MIRKRWVYSPKKVSVKVPLNEKETIEKAFYNYSLLVLSPSLPKLKDDELWRYTNFYGEWKRSYFYIGVHIKDNRVNVYRSEYNELRIRLEYKGPNLFLCSYMRHTDKWHELTYGKPITFEECMLLSKDFIRVY